MNEHFLITGAARGLGLAMTRDLLGRGCQVSALVRKQSEARAELRGRFGERLQVHVGDVTDAASVRDSFAEIARRHASLDAIINNAVTYLDHGRPSIETIDLAICERTFEVKAVGPRVMVAYPEAPGSDAR